ncbi:MAG TPA: glycogen synthase GlgA [Nitrospinota bacterium]|nr:glycogen synthase GlgA [Nitrospinota bacterium]
MTKQLSIAFVASEATPFAKTGGLADVAGSLPPALAKLGHKVSLFIPLYKEVDRARHKIPDRGHKLQVQVSARVIDAHYKKIKWRGVNVYFIESDGHFHRHGLYGLTDGAHPDNSERFSLFCMATLLALKKEQITLDVIHVNDWQSALVPVYLSQLFSSDKTLGKVATVLTVHNIGYQGIFNPLEWHLLGLDFSLFNMHNLEFYGNINFLKGGLIHTNIITTVSSTYAKEIQTKDGGYGLDSVLRNRSKDVFGVVNGIDTDQWNPKIDETIPQNFEIANMDGKKKCKESLLNEFGFPKGENPLIVMITRLAEQKGVDIGLVAIDQAISKGINFALLGSGSTQYEELAKSLKYKYPDNVFIHIGFDEALAHRMIAGADMFFMPSRYEPCGLTQMYSLAYGTVPIVRATGGLNDTVSEYSSDTKTGVGFKFSKYSTEAAFKKIEEAVTLYRNCPNIWNKMVINGMKEDNSWASSAKEYLKLYKVAIKHKQGISIK